MRDEHRDASRRAACASSIPATGYLACGWVGKGRLAEPETIAAAVDRLLGAAAVAGRASACSSPPVRRSRISIPCASSATDRAAAWALRSRAKPRARGAEVTLVAGPTPVEPPAVAELVRVRSAREMHAAVMARADRRRRRHHGRGRRRLHARRRRRDRQDRKGRRADARARAHAGHPRRARRASRRSRAARCSSASRRRPAIRSPAARRKLAAKRVDLIVANDVSAPGAGFDVDTNQVTLVVARRRRARCRCMSKARRRRRHPRSRRASAHRSVAAASGRDDRPPRRRRTSEALSRSSASTASRAIAAWRERGDAEPAPAQADGSDAERSDAVAEPLEPRRPSAGPSACAALAALRAHIGDCTRCKLHALGRTQVVFGVGQSARRPDVRRRSARAPTKTCRASRSSAAPASCSRRSSRRSASSASDVYIANVIKCRPPGNRNPEPDEVATCEPFLFQQIDIDPAAGHRRARHVRGARAAQDRRADLAAARPACTTSAAASS